MATAPPNYAVIKSLSFGALDAEAKKENRDNMDTDDVILSVLWIVVVIAVPSYFVK